LKKERKKYRCKKCKVKCLYAPPGIGDYCPKCGRDWGLEEEKNEPYKNG